MMLSLRCVHTSTIPSAAKIAVQFLSESQALPPQSRKQWLDPTQLQRLAVTLNSPCHSREIPTVGTVIPACHHLVYFTPAQVERVLGKDGTDRSYNPPAPFTRRMWAGGALYWTGEKNQLRVGQEVREVTSIESAEAKRTKTGEDMIIVGVKKTFENGNGIALIDHRNWVFRPEIITPTAPLSKPATFVPFPEGGHVRDILQTPVSLFRFSALTFNGHKIHYDRDWCRQVEGHRDLVVHGPLNLINMVNLWCDVRGTIDQEIIPKSVIYRITNPLYAGEPYRIVMEEEMGKITEVRIVDCYGNVSMTGRIESF